MARATGLRFTDGMTRSTDGMPGTRTTVPATAVRGADRPGTDRTPQPLKRDRTPPRGTTPQWYTEPPTARLYGPRAAERLLRSSASGPTAYMSLLHAARVLLHTGHPHRTAVWCTKLHDQAGTVQAPAWSAAFRTLRAEALLQLGDLAAAAHEAAAAQNATGPRDNQMRLWPTAVLAEALIAQGRYEEASAHLEQPTALEPTWQNLPWLRARGRLHLAAHRHHDALSVFRTVGRLARRHGPGRLPHPPWRTDTAEALLRLGRVERARGLLDEELAVLRNSGPRHHGIALRLLAASEEPGMRPDTLARALTELRRCKNRLELAHTLADLGHTLATLGEPFAADTFLRRAAHLADDCGATPLRDLIPLTPAPPTVPGTRPRLSSAATTAP